MTNVAREAVTGTSLIINLISCQLQRIWALESGAFGSRVEMETKDSEKQIWEGSRGVKRDESKSTRMEGTRRYGRDQVKVYRSALPMISPNHWAHYWSKKYFPPKEILMVMMAVRKCNMQPLLRLLRLQLEGSFLLSAHRTLYLPNHVNVYSLFYSDHNVT